MAHLMIEDKDLSIVKGEESLKKDLEIKENFDKAVQDAIDNRYTNNGYMKEALKIVLDYLLNEVKVDKVYCGCCIENIKSKKVMEKYMKYVTTLKNHVELSDGLHDMHLYVISKKMD